MLCAYQQQVVCDLHNPEFKKKNDIAIKTAKLSSGQQAF